MSKNKGLKPQKKQSKQIKPAKVQAAPKLAKAKTPAPKASAEKKDTKVVAKKGALKKNIQTKVSPPKVLTKPVEASKAPAAVLIAPPTEKAVALEQMAKKAAPVVTPAKAPAAKKRMSKTEQAAAEKLNLIARKWRALQERSKDVKAQAYSMNKKFEEKTPIQHKVLGWGYILSNLNDRLEVIFQDGVRTLISNYKA